MAENTLGAPTEGLGQTVTFAANPQGGIPQARAGQQAAVRNEVFGGQGVGVNRAMQVQDPGPDRTMQVLFKMGEKVLAPKIKEVQEQRFVAGMQKAAEGQAVSDIIDEQPWYAQMFGGTEVVDGARAYTASTRATEIATGIDAAMPELRKLNGAAFADHVHKTIAGSSTGDAATDAMVFQHAMKQMPTQMAQQAKQHYVYKQERFMEAQSGKWGADLINLGHVLSKAAKGEAQSTLTIGSETTDAFDAINATLATVDSFQRPEGQDEALYSRSVSSVLATAADNGNLAAVYALTEGAGGLKLRDQDRAHVQQALVRGERKLRTDMDAATILAIGGFKASRTRPDMTPEEAVAEAAEFNRQWKIKTGGREDIIPAGATAMEVTQIMERNAAKAEHEYERNRKAAEKAHDLNEKQRLKNENLQSAAAALLTGAPVHLKTKEEKEDLWALLRRDKTDSQYFAAMVNGQDRLINEQFKDTMQTSVRMAANTSNPTDLYNAYVSTYHKFRSAGALGDEAAAKYSGDFADRLDAYHRTIMAETGGDFSKASPQLRMTLLNQFNNPPAKSSGSDKKDSIAASVKSHIKGMNNIMGFQLAYGKMPVDDELTTALTDEVMAGAKHAPAGLKPDALYRIGVAQAGIEQFGGKFWRKQDGMVPIDQVLVKPYRADGKPDPLQIKASDMDAAIRHTLDKEITSLGGDVAGAQIIRMPDTGDKDKDASLWVIANGKSGPLGFRLSGSTIRQQWSDKQAAPIREELAKLETGLKVGRDIASGHEFTKSEKAYYHTRINQKLIELGQEPRY